jgi:catechol 2,3-dioxygenase-like lactoylglutathione lyase family enzyme
VIQKISHVTIYVLDQEEAKDFYVNKLGMDVKTDMTMDGGFRWLTVSPKGQPDVELILMSTEPGSLFNEEESEKLRSLIKAGKIGPGVFNTADCRKTYEELKAKGVKFHKEPTDEFYGTEALLEDNSGNWFSMSTPKAH